MAIIKTSKKNGVGEVAHHLRNTPNVIGFLDGSEKPVPLRQSEVNRILGTVDELQDAGEEMNIPYVVGETVKLNYGPFSGFSGIIEEVNTEKKKLKVIKRTTHHHLCLNGLYSLTQTLYFIS